MPEVVAPQRAERTPAPSPGPPPSGYKGVFAPRQVKRTDTAWSRHAARSLLGRLFGRAPESSRTIAVLYLVDGMTLEEVAEAVGLSVSGVRKRLRSLRGLGLELEGA